MKNKKVTLYIIVLVLAIASAMFKLLGKGELEQTSLLFIGIPALITVLLIRYTEKPKTAYGIVFLTVTIFLLISGIFLGEGFICILFMAPIFYGVSAILVAIYLWLNKKDKNQTYSFITIPVLLLLFNPFDYIKKVDVHSIKTVKEIQKDLDLSELNSTPNFLENLPTFFKIGFPKPIKIKGSGINIGDTRTILFKSSTKGVGKLVLEIEDKTEYAIVFKVNRDDTHMNHWLTFKKVRIEIKEQDGIKNIIWTTDFTCDLGPSWYFEPSEIYAVEVMNEYLINSYFKTKNVNNLYK